MWERHQRQHCGKERGGEAVYTALIRPFLCDEVLKDLRKGLSGSRERYPMFLCYAR